MTFSLSASLRQRYRENSTSVSCFYGRHNHHFDPAHLQPRSTHLHSRHRRCHHMSASFPVCASCPVVEQQGVVLASHRWVCATVAIGHMLAAAVGVSQVSVVHVRGRGPTPAWSACSCYRVRDALPTSKDSAIHSSLRPFARLVVVGIRRLVWWP